MRRAEPTSARRSATLCTAELTASLPGRGYAALGRLIEPVWLVHSAGSGVEQAVRFAAHERREGAWEEGREPASEPASAVPRSARRETDRALLLAPAERRLARPRIGHEPGQKSQNAWQASEQAKPLERRRNNNGAG